MSIGKLFLESLSSGVISQEELVWIAKHQLNFSRCEQATALKLGRLVDTGEINLKFESSFEFSITKYLQAPSLFINTYPSAFM